MLISAGSPPPTTLDDLAPPALRDRLDRLDVLSRRLLAGKLPGERRSKKRGQSVEFDDYRQYIPGDDLRHVDWNVYARFDRFVLKLFREEEDLAVHLVIDASASMCTGEGDPPANASPLSRPPPTTSGAPTVTQGTTSESKLVFAHRLGMALAYLALVAQNRVEVSVVGAGAGGSLGPLLPGGVATLAALRGRGAVRRVADFLADSLARPIEDRARAEANLADALRTIALRRASRGVMIVISDLLLPPGAGPLSRGLNYLAAGAASARYDTHCIHVLAPSELDPSLLGPRGLVGDLRLMDAETGRQLDVTVTRRALSSYRRRLDDYLARIQRDCLARSIAYLRVTSDTDVPGLLLGPLRQRGLLG